MIGLVVLVIAGLVWLLSTGLTMIIHDIIIGKEGREAEREKAKQRAEMEAKIARDRIEMRKEVDEIFRRQRERIKDEE